MGNRVGIVLAWTATTLVAVLVASAAVGSVRHQITDEPIALRPNSATIAALPTTTTVADSIVTTPRATTPRGTRLEGEPLTDVSSPGVVTATGAATSTTTTTNAPTSDTTAQATSAESGSDDNGSANPQTAAKTPTESPEETKTTTTTTTTSPPRTASYDLVGGSVRVEIGSNTVRFLSASPKGGFTVDVRDRGPEKVVVYFRSGGHESKFVGGIDEGTFHPKIAEESGGGNGGGGDGGGGDGGDGGGGDGGDDD
jgi:uncharacterized membrane protein YgcG